jgi:hypothetical protein
MTEEETDLLHKWLPKAGVALEFGSGGSTRFFFERGVWKLYTVESDPAWAKRMTSEPFLRHFIKKERLIFCVCDIGKTSHGKPISKKLQASWLNYHQHIWEHIPADSLDFALVDGRFRVACVFQLLLRCKAALPIFIHNFRDRTWYHPLLKFVDELDKAGTAIVVKRKRYVDWRRLSLLLMDHIFDPR